MFVNIIWSEIRRNFPLFHFKRLGGGIFLFIQFLLFATLLPAQNSRKALENKRRELIREIGQINTLLKSTRENREYTINQYFTLQKQIQKRQELINTLKKEVELSNLSIDRAREVVFALSDDVDKLKSEYGEMVRQAYRMKLTHNNLLFIFSAESFNDAFRRWNYLKQYQIYRQKQAKLIESTQATLSQKASQLEERKIKKEELLLNEVSQQNILTGELNTSEKLLAGLRSDERRLENKLNDKKNAHAELNKSISRIIAAEIERKRKAEAAKAKPEPKVNISPGEPKPPVVVDAEVASKLSADFQSNRGKLPKPVNTGVVIRGFGDQPHPALRNVQVSNNGVDIQTQKGAEVLSVFTGEVLGMQFIPSSNYMVIVQHGDYFTVYSNLEEVDVRRGDKMKTGEVIGRVGLDKISGNYEVHFEVWKNKTPQNPMRWIGGW